MYIDPALEVEGGSHSSIYIDLGAVQDRLLPANRTTRSAESPTRQIGIACGLTVFLGLEGLEQLNRVAGRIVDKDLLASIAGHDLIPEPPSGTFQFPDSGF